MPTADEASLQALPPARRFSVARLAAYALGLGLLIAAVIAVSGRTDALRQAVESARNSSPWLVLAVIVLPLANIAVISTSFWVLTSRFGRVALPEMIALIVSSWLLNHLPLRPGLVGRVGYHKLVNNIPVRFSVRVVIEQLLCGIAALGLMLLVAVLCAPLGAPVVITLLLVTGAAVTASGFALRHLALTASRSPASACITTAFGLRLLDMTLWIIRYLCLFALVGHDVGISGAAAITAASQAAMLSPIPLGLREWVVGAVHAWLGAEWISGSGGAIATFTPGIAADLANRAAELLVAVPLGILATLWLMRIARATRAARIAQAGAFAPTHPVPPSSV